MDKKIYEEKMKSQNVIYMPNPKTFTLDYESPLKNKKIISVGRLHKDKGFQYLIKYSFQNYVIRMQMRQQLLIITVIFLFKMYAEPICQARVEYLFVVVHEKRDTAQVGTGHMLHNSSIGSRDDGIEHFILKDCFIDESGGSTHHFLGSMNQVLGKHFRLFVTHLECFFQDTLIDY